MNIQFNFKNFDPSAHLKEYANTRFDKVAKYVGDSEEVDLQVNLSVDKFRQVAEIILTADSIHISAYEASEDMYATIDMVLDKLEAQLRRMREKAKSRRKARDSVRMDVISFAGEEGQRTQSIVETDMIEPKPMSVDEAAMQLETLNEQPFLVFHNAETERVNVIYRMKNEDFGLIDPGF